jgi:hypothetical protein
MRRSRLSGTSLASRTKQRRSLDQGTTMQILRSIFAVFAGLVLISVIVETLEFGLVTLVHGEVTTDPDIYFRVRNRPAFLATKVVYNAAAAIVGGLVATRLARRAPMAHGLVLAVIQTVAFGWALVTPALRRSTPDWMWACLIGVTFAGIMAGSLLQRHRGAVNRPLQPTP